MTLVYKMVNIINIDNCVSNVSIYGIAVDLGLSEEFDNWINSLDTNICDIYENEHVHYGLLNRIDKTFDNEDIELLCDFLEYCGGNYDIIESNIFKDDLFRVMRN